MRVGIHGYTGRLNSGDDAMYACMERRIQAMGHSVVKIDFPDGSLDRFVVKELDALVVGGGTLGVGFGWQLSSIAMYERKPLIAFGQGFGSDWEKSQQMTLQWLSRHQLVVARDVVSADMLRRIGVNCELGADPAFDLRCDRPNRKDGRAIVYIRRPGLEYTDVDQRKGFSDAMMLCKRLFLRPVLAASAKGDKVYVEREFGIECRYSRAEEQIDAIAESALVISIGRYHPAVYACIAGTPCMTNCQKALQAEADLGCASLRSKTVPVPVSPNAQRVRLDLAYDMLASTLRSYRGRT